MKHYDYILLGDQVKVCQVGKTKCLVRLNGEYATVSYLPLTDDFILVRVKGVGERMFRRH